MFTSTLRESVVQPSPEDLSDSLWRPNPKTGTMGSIGLLSRQGEAAIAKRIEAGRCPLECLFIISSAGCATQMCSVQLSRLIALFTTYNAVCRCRRVARTRILRRLIEREPVEPNDLFPGQQVGETAEHWPNMDGRAFPALLNCQAEIFASTVLGSRNT
jgi:hypothetical protein